MHSRTLVCAGAGEPRIDDVVVVRRISDWPAQGPIFAVARARVNALAADARPHLEPARLRIVRRSVNPCAGRVVHAGTRGAT